MRRDGLWPDTDKYDARRDRNPRRDTDTVEYVRKIWREAQSIGDTPAETYLRNRGIAGPIPVSLRYSVLKHTDTGLMLPCMIGAVQAADRQITGLQRTFLRLDGTDKAPVSSPRKMLGKVGGGAVRLAASEAEMACGEGLETSLSYQRATGISTWAALSAEGIKAIVMPPLPMAATVHLLVDLERYPS